MNNKEKYWLVKQAGIGVGIAGYDRELTPDDIRLTADGDAANKYNVTGWLGDKGTEGPLVHEMMHGEDRPWYRFWGETDKELVNRLLEDRMIEGTHNSPDDFLEGRVGAPSFDRKDLDRLLEVYEKNISETKDLEEWLALRGHEPPTEEEEEEHRKHLRKNLEWIREQTANEKLKAFRASIM